MIGPPPSLRHPVGTCGGRRLSPGPAATHRPPPGPARGWGQPTSPAGSADEAGDGPAPSPSLYGSTNQTR